MTEALSDIASGWAVELQGICVEEAALVVLPESGDDHIGPSFLLSREALGYRVDQVHWDVLTEVGLFPGMGGAIGAIRQRVCHCVPLAVPANATRH